MRVLVTGAAGRIGRAVLAELSARGDTAVAIVLADPGDLAADAVFVGSAADSDLVCSAMHNVDAVIHLAAIPSPQGFDAAQVFARNTQSTFVVLEQAGLAGVQRAAIASSYSANGLTWAKDQHSPVALPLTVSAEPIVEDPYGLSKQVDELTAAMMCRRYGMPVTALRLPYVGGTADRLNEHATELAANPERGARELWAYLETADAARATVLAIAADVVGSPVLYVAASKTIVPFATEDLLARYHPNSQLLRPIVGRGVPLDLEPAQELLGFAAQFELDLALKKLPVEETSVEN